MTRCYLLFGSNQGDKLQLLEQACNYINNRCGMLVERSSLYNSEPWGFESTHGFCNLCCRVETELMPLEVLHKTQAIERALGRTHKSVDGHYADRTIDIDLIRVFDMEGKEIKSAISHQPSAISDEPQWLTLPHPLWEQRDFVKLPLAEIMY